MFSKIEEENIKVEAPVVRDYEKIPIAICQLNSQFQHQEYGTQFNRIDKEFRNYVSQFSVIKKKEDGRTVIDKRFEDLRRRYANDLIRNGTSNKEYIRLIKKYHRTQIKAWNLNLDKWEDIKLVCNAGEIPDDYLREVAQSIKNDNHD